MQVTIEKIVFGGQGLARLTDGRVVFVWNALPGEVVDIRIIKKKKDYLEAVATHIVLASPHRTVPTMDYYLSSAAWDMMDAETEQREKTAIAKEVYEHVGGFALADLDIVQHDTQYGYRNKIEFSFCDKNFVPKHERADDHVEDISLAFFARGSKNRLAVEDCALASPAINNTAKHILAWVREQQIPNRSLKSLIVRSNKKGEVVAALFIKDYMSFDVYPKLDETLKGFHVYYSSHKSPASRPDELLYSDGDMFLVEHINSVNLRYGLLSFFQVNPPVFEQTLSDMKRFIDEDALLLDFYAGVGAIGLALADSCSKVVLVESNEEAVVLAKQNILENNIAHAQAHCVEAEKITDIISNEHTVIVDPPRAGMHAHVVAQLLAVKPKKILYLSCNLSTQARDVATLLEAYSISFSRLYNYFPRTPHVEGLLVLDRK